MRNEKQNTGLNYINFTAAEAMDVYLMYDRRATRVLTDTSKDASWLSAQGFVFTGKYLETTDAVRFYRVYKKSYNKGEQVALHGNRHGTTSIAINTNYFLILKKRGVTTNQHASSLCSQVALTNAKIGVSVNGTSINSGTSFDLGNLFKNTKKQFSVLIQNTGEKPLTFTNPPKFIGLEKNEFSILGTVPSQIEVGSSYTLTLEHQAISEQEENKSVSLVLETNDTNQNTFTVNLTSKSIFNYPVSLVNSGAGTSINLSPKIPFSDSAGISYELSGNICSGVNIDAATGTISGTPEACEKRTVSILAKNGTDSMSFNIEFSISGWKQVGDKLSHGFISTDVYTVIDFENINGVLHALYFDMGSGWNGSEYINGGMFLKKFDGSNWVQVGDKVDQYSSSYRSIHNINGVLHVLYSSQGTWNGSAQTGNGLFLKKLDGSNWVQVGDRIDQYFGYTSTLQTISGVIHVLYHEQGNWNGSEVVGKGFYLKKFDGANWVQVGDRLDIQGNVSFHNINGVPHILYAEQGNWNGSEQIGQGFYLKKFDGANWIQIGDKVDQSYSYSNTLHNINGVIHVLYFSQGTSNGYEYVGTGLYLKKFDGTNCIQVGDRVDQFSSRSQSLQTINGVIHILYYEQSHGLFLKKFDGTNWVQVGEKVGMNMDLIFGNSYSFYNLNGVPYVMYQESNYYGGYGVPDAGFILKKFDGTSWVQVGDKVAASRNQTLFSQCINGVFYLLTYKHWDSSVGQGYFLRKLIQ